MLMSFNVIASTISEVKARLAVPCSSEVPATRPDEFVTVERTGGQYELGKDNPTLAVQCWASTDAKAYSLALAVAEVLRNMRETVPQVCRSSVSSVYRFDAPGDQQRRYQIVFDLVCRP